MAIKKSGKATNDEIKMDVIEKCGVIAERSNGNTFELRYVAWNGNEPKYDLRVWSHKEDGTEGCFKGITLTGEELEKLGDIINEMRANES